MTDLQIVKTALTGLRDAYQADGYDLHVENVCDGIAKVRISAGPNACAECLVPKAMATDLIKMSLEGLPDIEEIDLVYPAHS